MASLLLHLSFSWQYAQQQQQQLVSLSSSNMDTKNIIVSEGVLTTPLKGDFKPFEVDGSYYQSILNMANKYLDEDGDWTYLYKAQTGETMTVLETIEEAKRWDFFCVIY